MLLQRLFTYVNTGGREQIVGSNSRHARYRDVIQWLSSEEEAQWDAFVMRHPLGVVYQLSAWKHVLEDAFPHIRGRFLVLRDSRTKEIKAGLPVYTVKSWLLGNRAVSVPFASICDPLISTMEELNLLLAQIHCAAKEVGAQKIELRSTKMQNECATSSLCAGASYKHHYLSLDKTADELFATFAKSSVRQKVNKAKRAGVIIEERDDEEGLRICHAILESTRRRLALPPMPYAFFQAMRRRLGTDHLNVYIAMHAGQAVATHLVLPFRDLWISEYTGNTNSAPHGVNQLLWWDTIQRAQASDARWFSFGRTSSDNEGLLAYKRRWAPIEEEVVHFTNKAPNASLTNARVIKLSDFSTLYGITKLLLRKAPTPVCRMIGNFCYRHLG